MGKLWTLVDRNRTHEKFEGYKLLVSDRNWNDYGYNTLYNITYQHPNDVNNKLVGSVKIFNPNSGENYKASITNTHAPYVAFICNKIRLFR